jgi:hypothetical protein
VSSPLVKGWLFATVPIDNPQGETGTGFLVFRSLDQDKGRLFLVTNKHVVHREAAKRDSVTHLRCHFNTEQVEGNHGIVHGDIPFRRDDGSSRYREHPDADTDVAAIEVTDVMVLNPVIAKRWAHYTDFADATKRTELDITVGEEVVTIGYPLGLRQGDSNFPLVRQGLIATRIGALLRDKVVDAGGKVRERSLRAFLIDGATIPGSSGSPVVLKPIIGRIIGSGITLNPAPPVLLGKMAETKYAPIAFGSAAIPSFAGLGLVFEAETIRETIELFFPSATDVQSETTQQSAAPDGTVTFVRADV